MGAFRPLEATTPATAQLSATHRVQSILRLSVYLMRDLSGRDTARAEDPQGTPTQTHISPSILVYEEKANRPSGLSRAQRRAT